MTEIGIEGVVIPFTSHLTTGARRTK